jgi:hypothetical protein
MSLERLRRRLTLVSNLTVLYEIEGESLEIISRVLRNSEISNPKHPARRKAGKQMSMKSQMSISKELNRFVILDLSHCDFFVICYLQLGILALLQFSWCKSMQLIETIFDLIIFNGRPLASLVRLTQTISGRLGRILFPLPFGQI